jgi:hypothetical protein
MEPGQQAVYDDLLVNGIAFFRFFRFFFKCLAAMSRAWDMVERHFPWTTIAIEGTFQVAAIVGSKFASRYYAQLSTGEPHYDVLFLECDPSGDWKRTDGHPCFTTLTFWDSMPMATLTPFLMMGMNASAAVLWYWFNAVLVYKTIREWTSESHEWTTVKHLTCWWTLLILGWYCLLKYVKPPRR